MKPLIRPSLIAAVLCLSSHVASAPLSEPITPIPLEMKLDSRKVDLGEKLFLDKRMSKDNSIACIQCHGYDTGGADRTPLSVGVGGQIGGVNAPSIFNLAFNFRLSWDGRDESLEGQARGPIHNPKVMGTTWEQLISKLIADDQYVGAFKTIYNEPPTGKNISDAIATFERSLITPNAPFDRHLRGEKNAITADEARG